MWTRRGTALAAALALLTALPAAAPAAEAFSESVSETYVVPTRHGDLYVEVVRPEDAVVPAILTLSPYSVLGRNSDADRWWPRGYARVWADVVGTGNSGGCYDYGGTREKETGYDLVEWIAAQPWSNGRIGMIGGSYNGTTATATAVTRPPHLTTIVPEAAISRWYEYAYSGGIRYLWTNEALGNEGPGSGADEGFDTPLAFDFGFAIPPPLDATGADWGERVASTVTPCDELEHTLHGYDFDLPDYGDFWLERDYVKDAGRIDIPVLVAHNWGDWNVKQEEAINLWRALDDSPKAVLYMGTRWEGHGRPGGDYEAVVDAWFDHYLKGVDNSIEDLPAVTSQMSDDAGPIDWYSGRWPRTRSVRLYAQRAEGDYEYQLLPERPRSQQAPAELISTGTNTETASNADPRANTTWIHFETPPLARDARIFGEIEIDIYSTVQRKWITYTPTIVDIAPDGGSLVSTTRGWLDSRYRSSLAAPEDVTPGAPFDLTVVAKPQDYTFRAGHRIGLNIQTEIAEWSVPKLDPTCIDPRCPLVTIDLAGAGTRVELPVVDAPRRSSDLFARP